MTDAGGQYAPLIEAARLAVGRGDRLAAEKLLKEAISIGERELGADHPALGVALNELSRLHVRQSDFARAEPILLRLVKLTRTLGDRHPDVATALAGLAVAKRGLGDDAGAELLFRRALRIREEALAPDHMAIVITLEQLSDTCAARGKYAEALVHLQRALMRRERALGADHATVRGLRTRIAGLERRHAEWTARAAERATAPSTPVIESTIGPAALMMLVETPSSSSAPAHAATDESPAIARPEWQSFRPSRRTKRFASGIAAVAVLAAAGFAFSSPARKAIEGVATQSGGDDRTALVSPASTPATGAGSAVAHRDSVSVATASGAYDAPIAATTRATLASYSPTDMPAAPVALPRLKKLVVPRVAMPSLDSAISANDAHDLDAEPIEAAEGLRKTVFSDEGSVTPPQLIGSAPTPRYPDELRTQRIEGEVVVQFRVNEKGRVEPSSMQVVQSPHPAFAAAVRSVLPRFRFEPARAGSPASKPQAAWVQFRTQFTAKR